MTEPRVRPVRAPSLALFATEGQRALFERLSYPATRPLLRSAPRGDGHPVLVLPGFMAADTSTGVLRRYLRDQGLSPHPWLQGQNRGPTPGVRDQMGERVEALCERYGDKVSIVGWSLGGIYARELAKRMPEHVRQVVSLGSPFGDAGRASNIGRLFGWVSGRDPGRNREAIAAQMRIPPDVPSTAIYSKADGIVHWRSCLEPDHEHTENIEVPGSHCGLGFNALALYAVADRLAQPFGAWKPFEPTGWRRSLYPNL